jgi:hypothetical protein
MWIYRVELVEGKRCVTAKHVYHLYGVLIVCAAAQGFEDSLGARTMPTASVGH